MGAVDHAAAEWAWSSGEAGGVGTGTLIAADWQFHPLRTSLGVLAVIGLAAPDGREPITPDRALLLSTLLGQAALAHERLRLEQDVREVSVLRERDRLRAALLSSIGHDLRTPLTSVAAAVDALAHAHPDEPATAIARAEVARLRRFLDNLIDMVRIDAGAVALSLEPIDLTDAAAAAVHDLRDVLAGRELVLRVPPDLPLVRADPRLLHHILLNLLSNAAVHGGDGPIEILGERRPDAVRLAVRDHGPGLPPGEEATIFETFARGTGSDRAGGSGLGLAIAKGFAGAMAAPIRAMDAEGGGALFAVDLQPV
jgi:two-component system sensor histidine kinase KdpD